MPQLEFGAYRFRVRFVTLILSLYTYKVHSPVRSSTEIFCSDTNRRTTRIGSHSFSCGAGEPKVLRLAQPMKPPGIDLTSRSLIHNSRSARKTFSSFFHCETPQAFVIVAVGAESSLMVSVLGAARFRFGVPFQAPGKSRSVAASLTPLKRDIDLDRLRRVETISSSAS